VKPLHSVARSAAGLLVLCTAAPAQSPAPPVEVSTDVFDIAFSRSGGVPIRWTVTDPQVGGRFALVDAERAEASPFQHFGVVTEAPGGDGLPESDRRSYTVSQSSEGDLQVVRFTAPAASSGLQIEKTYEFRTSDHVFSLRVALTNRGAQPLTIGGDDHGAGLTLGPGLGYSASRAPELFDEGRETDATPFFKTSAGVFGVAIPEAPFVPDLPSDAGEIEWAGIERQYFALAVVPETTGAIASARVQAIGDAADPQPCVTLWTDAVALAPGETVEWTYHVYAGPKEKSLLAASGLGLEALRFHHLWNWLASLCRLLEVALRALYGVLGSWGLAIVVFAVLFRLVTLPLSLFGAKNHMLVTAKMAEIKPQIAEIKKTIKDGEKRNHAILALYKANGMNPFSQLKGCLPLVIQLPVLIALFQLLLNSYDLRGESFLWITDLTLTDRLFALPFTLPWLGSYFNLLPVLMLVSMVIVGRIMASSGRMPENGGGGMKWGLPLAMTALFYPFPSGCMLFWTMGTMLQVGEQKLTVARLAQ